MRLQKFRSEKYDISTGNSIISEWKLAMVVDSFAVFRKYSAKFWIRACDDDDYRVLIWIRSSTNLFLPSNRGLEIVSSMNFANIIIFLYTLYPWMLRTVHNWQYVCDNNHEFSVKSISEKMRFKLFPKISDIITHFNLDRSVVLQSGNSLPKNIENLSAWTIFCKRFKICHQIEKVNKFTTLTRYLICMVLCEDVLL